MKIKRIEEKNKTIKYSYYALNKVMTNIHESSYGVPNFQRDYVWSRDKIIMFLNSILNDEPFGFIIMWKNNNDNSISTRNDIIRKISKDCKNNEWYIIDGQQRLTSMYSLFMNGEILSKNEKKGLLRQMKSHINSIYLNLSNNTFEKINSIKDLPKNYFPLKDVIYDWSLSIGKDLRILLEQPKYQDFTIEQKDDIKEIIEIINNKLRKIDVGSIELDGYNIDEVIDIFNKINTQGKKLTLFEIINSKWHGAGINLESEFADILQGAENYGFGENDNQIPLDSLFLLLKNENGKSITTGDEKMKYDIKEKSVYVKSILDKFKISFTMAYEFLSDNKFNYKTLPSKIIFKWLTYLFYQNNNKKVVNDMRENILKYIYLLSINQLYSKSTTTH